MIWWTKSWNPIIGCTKCSPACDNCYAERLHTQRHKAKTQQATSGLPQCYAKPFDKVQFMAERLSQPLHWRKPQRVFVGNMGDIFHPDVQDGWLDRIFAVMALSPQNTFMLLTKRPERMREYIGNKDAAYRIARAAEIVGRNLPDAHPGYRYGNWTTEGSPLVVVARRPLPNVWLGTTIWDQASADRAVPILLETPAAKRFVSVEPMLGPVDMSTIRHGSDPDLPVFGTQWGLDWVICGGETGPGARPMHPDWPRSLRDQCQAAQVPYFFKQWGEWAQPEDIGNGLVAVPPGKRILMYGQDMIRLGTRKAGRVLDGQEWSEVPNA